MIWEIGDHEDHRIMYYTFWKDIVNYKTIEKRSGVFLFADENHDIKYIGKANFGEMVNEIFSALRSKKELGSTLLKVLFTNTGENTSKLEIDLVKKYNPHNYKKE